MIFTVPRSILCRRSDAGSSDCFTDSSITVTLDLRLACDDRGSGGASDPRVSTRAVDRHTKEKRDGNSRLGQRTKVIARTTTLSAGDANMAVRTDSVLIPEAKKPRAIGATQFVQTACSCAEECVEVDGCGAPTAHPRSVSAAGPKRRERLSENTAQHKDLPAGVALRLLIG